MQLVDYDSLPEKNLSWVRRPGGRYINRLPLSDQCHSLPVNSVSSFLYSQPTLDWISELWIHKQRTKKEERRQADRKSKRASLPSEAPTDRNTNWHTFSHTCQVCSCLLGIHLHSSLCPFLTPSHPSHTSPNVSRTEALPGTSSNSLPDSQTIIPYISLYQKFVPLLPTIINVHTQL